MSPTGEFVPPEYHDLEDHELRGIMTLLADVAYGSWAPDDRRPEFRVVLEKLQSRL